MAGGCVASVVEINQDCECSITTLVELVTGLEDRVDVTVIAGPEVVLNADLDQLDQMLINLLRDRVAVICCARHPGIATINYSDLDSGPKTSGSSN